MRTFLFAAVVVMASASSQASQQTASATIQGKVIRAGTSEPISGVMITLISPGTPGANLPAGVTAQSVAEQVANLIATAPPGISPETIANAVASMEQRLGVSSGPQLTATTDTSGTFSFKGLAPGSYSIRAQREGYFGPLLSGSTTYSTIVTSTVNVEAQSTPEVSLSMIRGAIVSGRVRDPNGQPSSGVTVAALRLDYREGRPTLVPVNSKTTDDRGEYRLFWLPPGDYYVAATPRRPTGISGPQDTWVRTFFPGATDARRVSPLVVGEGAELAAIDIGIQTFGSGVKVSGNVRNTIPSSTGQPNATVTSLFLVPDDPLVLTDAAAPSFINTSADRTNGRFEIRGVPPGRYNLIVSVPAGPQNRPFPGRTMIDVGNQDLDGVRVDILPGVDVKARVVFDGPTPAAGTSAAPAIRLQLQPREIYQAPFQMAIILANTTPTPLPPPGVPAVPPPIPFLTADGSFVFTNVPQARYAISVAGLPANAYVADIRMGGTSVYDTGFFIGREASQPLEVIVNAAGARVEGNVLDALNKTATAGRVVLVPAEARRQNPALYKTALADAKGTFRIAGVVPGDYKLFAWNHVPGTAYMNAEFMAKYEARGQSVRVTAGQTINQDVQLIAVEADRR